MGGRATGSQSNTGVGKIAVWGEGMIGISWRVLSNFPERAPGRRCSAGTGGQAVIFLATAPAATDAPVPGAPAMTGFASAERRPRPCNRLVLRLDPCQTLVSAEGGHSRLAWRMRRHLF